MSYLALARKWRPRTFSELLGQEHLVRALSQSLTQDRVHHAYLFTGTRGVGKTSIARILAKALNCLQGPSAEPCLTCDNCQAIEQGRFLDLIEIDAASKTRVEDTRELLDNVQYAPSIGSYKIYLIDEVHMLSQHSFNALLKTLEEPPSHVKFLLATTDIQKLPVTILSRCLQFHLKHVPETVIGAHLQTILNSEPVTSDPQALAMIAKAARGSMRDALSLLDQCLSGNSGELTTTHVANLLGQTSEDYALQILLALIEQNPLKLITISREIGQSGAQFRFVLDELLSYFHRISVVQTLPTIPDYIESEPEIAFFAQQLTPEDTQLCYQIGLKGLSDIPYAPSPNIGFEMILLRMFTFKPASLVSAPKLVYEDSTPVQIKPLEVQTHPATETASEQHEVTSSEEVSAIDKPALVEVVFNPPELNPNDWAAIIPQLQLTGLALTAIQHSELIEINSSQLTLKVDKSHQSIFTPSVISRIQDSLCQYFQKPTRVNIQYHNDWVDSPAAQKKTADTQQQEAYTQALLIDPVFQQLRAQFSATLIHDSITAAVVES